MAALAVASVAAVASLNDSKVILEWSKNHPENHYLKIAILCVALAVASAASSLNDLKIQLCCAILEHISMFLFLPKQQTTYY